jgi:hypothetical protein
MPVIGQLPTTNVGLSACREEAELSKDFSSNKSGVEADVLQKAP